MKYLSKVAYLGANYKGFERQKSLPSIQGELERSLSYLFAEKTLIHGAGRTDAGVNARGQTFSFEGPDRLVEASFVAAMNHLLPSDIAVLSLRSVPALFDARHSAKGKVYSYRFHLGLRDPLSSQTVYQMPYPQLDLALFASCLALYAGEHDFRNFTPKASDPENFHRTLAKPLFSFDEKTGIGTVVIEGNGFMTYMVRTLVGVAFKVGLQKMTLAEVSGLLAPKERKILSYKAPAEGLCLEEVRYDAIH
jgi:tRNA pseudouridine38-40 synthase